MSELKPCPFCGAKADDTQGFHGLTVIGCNECLNAQTQPFDERHKAVASWNRRARPDAIAELIDVLQEVLDFGEPSTHYRDAERAKEAFARARQLLAKLEGK